jgi:hypothetical protein
MNKRIQEMDHTIFNMVVFTHDYYILGLPQ